MEFEIADIVIYKNNLENRFLVLATKKQDFTLDFYNSKTGIYYIKDVEKLAKLNLSVLKGFDYKIGKIIGNENGYSVIGEFKNVFNDHIGK